MLIYIINVILLSFVVLVLFVLNLLDTKKGKMTFLIIATLQLILLQGLRNESVGADTRSYLKYFNHIQYFDMEAFISHRFEIGYKFLNNLLAQIGINDQIFLTLVSALILVPVSVFLYKNSTNVYLSLYLYITFGFYAASFNTLRQNIAYGIILLSFQYIRDRKFIPFLLIVLLASTFHFSALIFAFAYFLARIKLTIPTVSLIVILTIPIAFLKNQITAFIISNFYQTYNVTHTNAYTWFFFNLTLFAIAMLYHQQIIEGNEKRLKKKNDRNLNQKPIQKSEYITNTKSIEMYYTLTFIGILLMLFASVSTNAMRIVNYFYLFIIVLLPASISGIRSKYIRSIVTLMLIFGAATVYIYFLNTPSDHNFVPYKFYW
ncbi:EpsG family protein [Halobacillus halophilus]|uniref:EpsG family protein n=1 Tax=Halobacillus halophilus TaxID=1570 RepID=UPI001CD35278|nr:EpsG family protein [Halobacillus halophilus]MCA1010725.1 EpsG family protein [Halobacillus halophilus]